MTDKEKREELNRLYEEGFLHKTTYIKKLHDYSENMSEEEKTNLLLKESLMADANDINEDRIKTNDEIISNLSLDKKVILNTNLLFGISN